MQTENYGNFPSSLSPCQMWKMILHGGNGELTQKKMQEETKGVSRTTLPRLWEGSCTDNLTSSRIPLTAGYLT